MPDTAGQGFEHFNRMFFAQIDRQAPIVGDRKDSGGQAASDLTELPSRPDLGNWNDRDGLVVDTLDGAIDGPRDMLVDQDTSSGCDFMPCAFQRAGLGALIAKRTWGCLIGSSASPALLDGGILTMPFLRCLTPEGEWHIDNEGASPDVDVELRLDAISRGGNTQLEAAIADILNCLDGPKPVQRKTAPPAATLRR